MDSFRDSQLLSARGSRLIVEGGHSTFHSVLDDIYHPEENPNGILSLGLAENSLMHNELVQYIHDTFKISGHYLMYGDGSHGSKRLRDVVARFVNRHFHPVTQVESSHVHVSPGVSNALEMLAYTLANSGDGFLIGRPYYGSFPGDFGARAGVKTVGVPFGPIDPLSLETIEKYEEVLLRSNSEGVTIKAVVLCTPHNPLGRCYSKEFIIQLMKLCQKHKVHLISDEIYALSIWDNPDARDAPKFTSALSIDTTGIIDPLRVHVLWGMSKDFGANGLRVGYVIDQHNPEFRESLIQISLANYPAAPSDQISAAILENNEFTDTYIRTNQTRIAEAYAYTTKWLTRQGIPYTPGGNAGFFLWANLKAAVTASGKAYDHDLLKNILNEKKLSIADALAFGGEEEGWFRVIFTHPTAFLDKCFERLGEVLVEYEKVPG